MNFKCPGQDKRNISAENISCPFCGYKLEIFSDEHKATCSGCGNCVFKEQLPNCALWCKSAKECIGLEKWNEIKGSSS